MQWDIKKAAFEVNNSQVPISRDHSRGRESWLKGSHVFHSVINFPKVME